MYINLDEQKRCGSLALFARENLILAPNCAMVHVNSISVGHKKLTIFVGGRGAIIMKMDWCIACFFKATL